MASPIHVNEAIRDEYNIEDFLDDKVPKSLFLYE